MTSNVDIGKEVITLVVTCSDLSHQTPAQTVTSVLLNENFFHVWSNSLHLYLGGKRKMGWLLGKEVQSAETDAKCDEWFSDNCNYSGLDV